MSDEHPSDIDLDAAHLRPAQRPVRRPATAAASEPAGRIPWEGARVSGLGPALVATWWRFVRAPAAAWEAVPRAGGGRRPWTFALLCGGIFGVVSEIIDSSTVALLRYGGVGAGPAQALQLDIAGRSLDWLPLSALSLAGCLLALLVAVPLYLLVYGLLVIAWTALLHLLAKLGGALAGSSAGFQGTLRAVCYSQAAVAAAIVPWIGDPLALVWSFWLQVGGLVRMHGCSRRRAALVVGLPAALLVLALVASLILGEPETVTGPVTP